MIAPTLTGGLLAAAGAGDRSRCCAIVELRQYSLHPQRFEPFVALFEDEFLEPLEAAGMTVIGQFRDLDDPDRFVWLRGFADMPSRATALANFYDGPIWKARRDAANANFTDTDNVLLLHPVGGAGIALPPAPQRLVPARGLVVVVVYPLTTDAAGTFPALFAEHARPALAAAGIVPAATFESDASVNTFPRLPVREGEHVFVWLATFGDRARGDAALRALAASPHWRDAIAPLLRSKLIGEPQVLRLAPTARSRLRG